MPTWITLVFLAGGLFAWDFAIGRREATAGRRPGMGRLAWRSTAWLLAGLAVAGPVLAWHGTNLSGAYLSSFLIEKAMAADAAFVFVLVFDSFAVPAALRPRALSWAVAGALATRMVIVVTGWALPLRLTAEFFGVFLVATGIAFASQRQHALDPERSLALRLLRRVLPVTDRYQGQRFLVRRGGVLMATPLLGAVVLLDTVDGFFMLPITLVFAITKSPLVVAASNLFALLGLRETSTCCSPGSSSTCRTCGWGSAWRSP